MVKKNQAGHSIVNRLHGWHKLLISILFGLLVFFLVPTPELTFRTHVSLGWNAGCLVFLILSWITFFTITSDQIRQQCRKQDETQIVIFVLILVATIASFSAVLLLLTSKDSGLMQEIQLITGIISMMFSWILVHTIFALRYAHLYYGNDKENPDTHAGGLIFPEDEKPDYLDFAYFSFVVGMTFQVSDVEISSKLLRRINLLHGFISFIFNTFVVALTINIIAGLHKGN